MSSSNAVRPLLEAARTQSSPSGAQIDATEVQGAWTAAGTLDAAEVDEFKRLDPGHLTSDARRTLRSLLQTGPAAVMSLPGAPASRTDRFAFMRRVLGLAVPQPASGQAPAQLFDASGKPIVQVREPSPARQSAETAAKRLELWDYRDAATSWITPNNASLRQRTYGYGTHKPRDAWIEAAPANGVLELSIHMTPSTHAGSTYAEQQANFEKFAKENVYRIEVEFPDGTTVSLPPAGMTLRNRPNGQSEYVTVYDLAIPLMKGDTKISGWPEGSAATYGYIERRQTVIHNP